MDSSGTNGGGGELRMRLFTGTWNTAGHVPSSSSLLEEWLNPELDDRGKPPDVVAIGLQELVELTPGNVVLDSFLDTQSRANCQLWLNLLQEYMDGYGRKNGTRYFAVTDQRLLGTYLVLFCTIDFRGKLSDIQRAHVPTGAGGRLGNKGSIAIRFRVGGDTSICIVCSHMAAHREAVAARNEEFRLVASRPLFTDRTGADAGDEILRAEKKMGGLAGLLSAVGGQVSPREGGDPNNMLCVLQHDICIWMGDLNYRILDGVPVEAVLELISTDKLEVLRDLDQLNRERSAGKAFEQFYEGPLSFPPTYKVIPGTAEYDMRPEKKTRCPSWCDRVLWSIGSWGGDSIRRMAMDRYWRSGPLLSDHLPVSAVFNCAFTTSAIHPDSERLAVEQLMCEWQRWSDLNSGAIEMAPPALSMRHLDCDARVNVSIELYSTLPFDVQFHICECSRPEWLSLSRPSGTIEAARNLPSASVATFNVELVAEHIPAEESRLACALLKFVFSNSGGTSSSGDQGGEEQQQPDQNYSQICILPVICSLNVRE